MGLRDCQKGPYHICNMYMDMRIVRVTDLKSEVRFNLGGCLEAVVASEAAKRAHTIYAICTWISR